MFKIEAIVRTEKLEDVKDALNAMNINGITVSQVMGCGSQKGWNEVVRGTKVDINMLPKIKFEIVVSSQEWLDKTVETLIQSAYTGNIGDGKIFISKLEDVIRIRTGEHGTTAIHHSGE